MQISFIDLQKLLHCSFELVSGLFPGPLCCLILVLNMRKVAVWTTISLQAAQLCREENAWVALTPFMSFPVLHLTRGITMFSSHAQRGHCTGPLTEILKCKKNGKHNGKKLCKTIGQMGGWSRNQNRAAKVEFNSICPN